MAQWTSYEHDKDALLRRLRKREGQVRGLQQMVEDGRSCLDVVQQINALSAAAREVALIVLEDLCWLVSPSDLVGPWERGCSPPAFRVRAGGHGG